MFQAWVVSTVFFSVLFAAEPGIDFTVYGVAGTTIAILLFFIRSLWADNRELARDVRTLLERTTEAMAESSTQMAESSRAMAASVKAMEKVLDMPTVTPEQVYDLVALLREVRSQSR